MKRICSITICRLTFIYLGLSSGMASFGEEAIPSKNAALHYYLAFHYCRPIAQHKSVREATAYDTPTGYGIPVSEGLAKLFTQDIETGLVELHRGTTLPGCDWPTNRRADGPFVQTPHGELAHQLARVALLRARWRFEHGKWNEGLDDVMATFVLARHIGRDRQWSNIHFGCMMETMCTTTIAVYLKEMPEGARDMATKRIALLPPFTSMREALQASDELIDWAVDEAQKANQEKRLESFISNLVHQDKTDAKEVIRNAGDINGLIRLINSTRQLTPKLDHLMKQLPKDYEQDYKREIAPEFVNNPIAESLINLCADVCRSEEAAAHCRLEALKTALDIQRRGKLAILDHPDPYGSGPFGYEELGTGYKLTSEFRYAGQSNNLDLMYGTIPNRPQK